MRYALVAALLLVGLAENASSGGECDCYHLPWEPPECARRCGNSFLREELQRNEFIIELSSIAENQGASADLKAAAAKTTDERRQLRDRIASLAERRHADLEGELVHKDHNVVERLRAKTGQDLEVLYVSTLIKATHAEMERLGAVSKGANDADVKAVAVEILPLAREENQRFRSLADKRRK